MIVLRRCWHVTRQRVIIMSSVSISGSCQDLLCLFSQCESVTQKLLKRAKNARPRQITSDCQEVNPNYGFWAGRSSPSISEGHPQAKSIKLPKGVWRLCYTKRKSSGDLRVNLVPVSYRSLVRSQELPTASAGHHQGLAIIFTFWPSAAQNTPGWQPDWLTQGSLLLW